MQDTQLQQFIPGYCNGSSFRVQAPKSDGRVRAISKIFYEDGITLIVSHRVQHSVSCIMRLSSKLISRQNTCGIGFRSGVHGKAEAEADDHYDDCRARYCNLIDIRPL